MHFLSCKGLKTIFSLSPYKYIFACKIFELTQLKFWALKFCAESSIAKILCIAQVAFANIFYIVFHKQQDFNRSKFHKSSGIRQKVESQNECFKKAKHAKISENKYFLPSDTHTYVCVSGGKKCLFFGNFSVLCVLETPVLRFALLPYYRRN